MKRKTNGVTFKLVESYQKMWLLYTSFRLHDFSSKQYVKLKWNLIVLQLIMKANSLLNCICADTFVFFILVVAIE